MSARDVRTPAASLNPMNTDTNRGSVPALCPESDTTPPPGQGADSVNAPVGPGQFPLGNTASLTTGDRSQRSGPKLFPERAGILLERECAIVRDLGGDTEVSTAKRELVTRLVQASAIADSLASDFITHGVLTGKGRTRRSVATWLSVIDRVHRLAHAVGLERKTKTIDLAQALAEHQR